MINIEKNIPMPGIGEHIASALNTMEVGDSFILEKVDVNLRATLYRKMSNAAPRAFITRTVPNGTRVWRMK